MVFTPSADEVDAAGPPMPGITLTDSCRAAPPDWHVHYRTRNGHATSGVWSVATSVSCTQGKSSLSIDGYLLHDGAQVPGMDAGGRCSGPLPTGCWYAGGKDRLVVASGIAGSWQLQVVITMQGPDTLLYAQSDGCTEDVPTTTMTCTATSTPYVIN